ncbi:DUF4145 domain-containing protein [Ancylobacter oerskovii]|uniref:DUF4145 domain-containing protein n=1 Tax=Ancylobacter oerskovii TaxID=459519 RepID=A0ABW4YUR1_9HYPH|nr:DUF4145 domain-containing protein [Ancylobacter oerskovii]MBS7544648.1 hypothetical protein [Ancylobacter oerskovii]
MTGSKIGTKLKAFCANCKGERNCEIKGYHYVSEENEHISWWTSWYLLVCCGCDHVFAQSVSSDSESHYPVGYDRDGNTIYENDTVIKSWPARFKRNRPEWVNTIHSDISHERGNDLASCIFQVYEALDHDLNILAAIGIRTTFDIAAEILGVDPEKPFNEKLKSMGESGHLSPTQRDDFEVLINAGSASAHRGWNPKFDDLDPLVHTLENFINDKFVIPGQRKKTAEGVAKMRDKVPVRQRQAKKAGKPDSSNGDDGVEGGTTAAI